MDAPVVRTPPTPAPGRPLGTRMTTPTRSIRILLLACSTMLLSPVAASWADDAGRGGATTRTASPGWPLWFEPAASDGAFLAHGAGYEVVLTGGGAMMTAGDARVAVSFVGGQTSVPRAERPAGGVSHHFIGNDPDRWRRDVPHFEAVRYPAVYPGVDVLFHAARDATGAARVEYDFVVAPGADPRAIAVRLEGAAEVTLDDAGQLVARNGSQAVVHRRPVAFQEIDGARQPVDVAFEVQAGIVRFRLGAYDPRHALTIDPIVVVFGTLVGGSDGEFVEVAAENGGIAVDAAGNVFIAGDTASGQVVGGGPIAAAASPNVFLVKIDPTGSAVSFATFVGGNAADTSASLALGGDGSIYVGGRTLSSDLPTTPTAVKSSPPAGGFLDGFFVRLDATGIPVYVTYVGGAGHDTVEAVAARGMTVAITGLTGSTTGFSGLTGNAAQPAIGGDYDAYVIVMDFSQVQPLRYGSFHGGADADGAYAIGIDSAGRVVLGGFTESATLPAANPLYASLRGGRDGFVARFDPATGARDYSSFFGGSSSSETISRLVVDASDHLVVAGVTDSTDLPAGPATPAQATSGGDFDAFVARLDLDAAPEHQVLYRSYLGGASADSALALAVDARNRIIVGGYTASANFPKALSLQPALGGSRDGFIARFSEDGATLDFSTLIGGAGEELVLGLASSSHGLYVLGQTASDAPMPLHSAGGGPAIDATRNGATDAFVARLDVSDLDGDGMDDDWELDHGLDPRNPADASLDNDHDGASNLKEFQDGTDPNAAVIRYFAEGATGLFATRFALMNDDETRQATVNFEFLVKDGPVIAATRTIGPRRRITLDAAADVPGLETAEFSTSIRSNLPITADRTMTWGAGTYGAHSETAVVAPASTWYLAEGSTGSGLQLFYLIQNPNPVAVEVTVRYLLLGAAPVQKTYPVGPRTRETIWVNMEEAEGVPLDGQQLSAVLTSAPATPIIVERAMYLTTDGGARFWGAGHESAGVTHPATRWLLAEGATHSGFNLFVLVANPNAQKANLTLTYLLASGPPVVRTLPVDGNRRETVWVNLDPELNNRDVSTIVESDVPVVVERAMWWPGPLETWYEAHNSAGATATARKWLMAEGEVGPFGALDSYVLLANASSHAGVARVTLVFEDGTAPVTGAFTLGANSRRNVWVGVDIGDATLVGKRFGAIVESVGVNPVDLVVERAMYWTTGGRFYEAGTNSLASPR